MASQFRSTFFCRLSRLAVDQEDLAELEVNPLIADPAGAILVEHARRARLAAGVRRSLPMGIRKSVGKNKKSKRPAAAAEVVREGTMRNVTRARPKARPR